MPPIKDSTGSTFNRGDFTALNAFFWSSLDLSPYHGTDVGSTPYFIELIDNAGKKATGYIGAVGAGETLGSEISSGTLTKDKLYKITATEFGHFGYTLSGVELVTNGGMESGNPPTGWIGYNYGPFDQSGVQKHSGSYSAHITIIDVSYRGMQSDGSGNRTVGKKYKLSFWYYLRSGEISYLLNAGNGGVIINNPLPVSPTDVWTYVEYLFTETETGTLGNITFYANFCIAEFYIDDVSIQEVTDVLEVGEYFTSLGTETCDANNKVKQVTDPPLTAIHIVSSLNGTTRNWESIDSGFDPNNIASWGIYDSSTLLSPSIDPSESPSASPSMSPSISPSASPSAEPVTGGAFIIFGRRRR